MSAVNEMLAFNEKFVSEKTYEKYRTSKYPAKRIAILTCMDTRLVELLPAALGIRNGDVKMIKNAGAMVTDPYDSSVRSLLIGIVELGCEEVMVIGHTDCGVSGISGDKMIEGLIKRGVPRDEIDRLREAGVDFGNWFQGFDNVENAVSNTILLLRTHPLIPKDIQIHGYVMDTETGRLTLLED